jgi:hypothetical protein
VTAICDRDIQGRLFGVEILLYEDERINYALGTTHLQKCDNIYIEQQTSIYVHLRKERMLERGSGFGRTAQVYLDDLDQIAYIMLPWIESGAATPRVDAFMAMSGLKYEPEIPDLF